jgi:hypothetical protein
MEEDAELKRMRVDKVPAVIALFLLFGRLVQPVDVLVVVFLSGYLCILSTVSRSMRSDGVTPILPSLPPQGHVPDLVSNPLGNAFTNSDGYDLWLKFGTSISVVAPIALVGQHLLFQNNQAELAKYCARHVFSLCCQAVSESISRKVMVSCRLCSSCSLLIDFECLLFDSNIILLDSSSPSYSGTHCLQYSTTGATVELDTRASTLGIRGTSCGGVEFVVLGNQLVRLSITNCRHAIHASPLFWCRS